MLRPVRGRAQYAALRTRRSMKHLTRHDYAALDLVAGLQPAASDSQAFAQQAVYALTDWIASELTTLSVCDLVTGHRKVVGLPGVCLGQGDIACFDWHFFEHPWCATTAWRADG